MDDLIQPQQKLQEFLDKENLVIQLSPLRARQIQDGAIIIEMPSVLVGKKEPKEKLIVTDKIESKVGGDNHG